MNNKQRRKAKKMLWNVCLSTLLSFVAVFCIPDLVRMGMQRTVTVKAFPAFALIICCVLILITCAVSYIQASKRTRQDISMLKALWRSFAVILLILVAGVILSLLCGVMATFVYAIMKNADSIDKVKAVIDVISQGIILFCAPVFLSVFWEEVYSGKGTFADALSGGLQINKKRYIRLLILTVIVAAIGFLTTAVMNNANPSADLRILKFVLFAIIGIVSITNLQTICEATKEGR